MDIVNIRSEYIKRRLKGENVIHKASLFGQFVLSNCSGNAMVISANKNSFSFYDYSIENNKFHLDFYQEYEDHGLIQVITDDLCDISTSKWWKHVFFDNDGKFTYDTSYDNLRISEKSDLTFLEMFKIMEEYFETISFERIPKLVYITGDYAQNPFVRYYIQERLFPIEPEVQIYTYDDSIIEGLSDLALHIALPQEKLLFTNIQVSDGLSLGTLVSKTITVDIPLLCSNNILVNNISWNSLLLEQNPDYMVGSYGFKKVKIHAECDVFDSVFLSCTDLRGNKIIKEL